MGTTTDRSIAVSCNYCGRENPDRLSVCLGCGTSLAPEPAETEAKPRAKSKALAVLLALGFGPLGLFYASVFGALTMIVIALPVYVLTHGGLFFHVAGRVICAVWAYVALRGQDEASKPRREATRLLDEAAHLESSDRAKAIAVYEEIVRLFPDTPAAREAARNIQTLSQHT